MGLVVLVVGVIGLGAVGGAVVVFTVLRSRRNIGTGQVGPGVGAYPQNIGYPPQQPYPPSPYRGDIPLLQDSRLSTLTPAPSSPPIRQGR